MPNRRELRDQAEAAENGQGATAVAERVITGAEWERVVLANQERLAAIGRAETIGSKWTEAKDDLKDKQQAFDEACENNDDDQIASCGKDLHSCGERFDVIDRKRRSELDHARKMEDRLFQVLGEVIEFLPQGPAKATETSWRDIYLADLLGDMQAAPFSRVSIFQLGHLAENLKSGGIKQHVRDNDLTQAQVDFANTRLQDALSRKGVVFAGLPKAKQSTEIPPATAPAKKEKTAPADAEGDNSDEAV